MLTTACSAYPTDLEARDPSFRLTEFINAEYRDKGVLAYSVHPRAIKSNMSSTMPDDVLAAGILVDTPELAVHLLLRLIKERRDWLAG